MGTSIDFKEHKRLSKLQTKEKFNILVKFVPPSQTKRRKQMIDTHNSNFLKSFLHERCRYPNIKVNEAISETPTIVT